MELALAGGDLGAVAVPPDVDLLRREVPLDQVRRVPRPLPGRVVALRFFFRRAARPSSRITAATVFLLTAQPSSRRSAVIRGEPYLPSCAANSLFTSALSRSCRAARGGSTASSCLQNQDRDTPSARQASAAGMPCSSLWAAIRAATATAPSRP